MGIDWSLKSILKAPQYLNEREVGIKSGKIKKTKSETNLIT